jgi:DNA helicase-2/ATP-dependent DNA helicase PcrA
VEWLDLLNPAQRVAVTTTDGPLLIVAGPGSGKTRVIVHRVAYLVDGQGVPPWRILAVTFTNKAAREMRNRLDALLGPDRARPLSVGTFHATCARWLRTDGEQIGLDRRFAILDDGDQLELVKRAIRDLEIDEKRFSPRALLSAISGAKSELVSPERYADRAEGLWQQVVGRVYGRYQELLDESHALDFDDLLGKAVELFRSAPDVLERYQDRYPYLMVDEFQDTNVAQYELVRLLGAKYRNVCVVGDEDQSIYGWRKADARNIQHFERDFPELKIVLLEQNYRSTQMILDVAGAVITPNENRKPKRLWTDNPRGVPVVLHEAYDERDEALFVVRQVEALRRAGARYDDVAVTYRTNAQSRALEDALVRYGVAYRLVGGTRFYQRREVKDVLAYLRLLANPADGVSFERVINVPARGIGPKTVSDLQLWAARLALPLYEVARLAAEGTEEIGPDGRVAPVVPMATRPRALLGQFVSTIEAARERLATGNLGEALDFLLEKIEYKDYVVDGTDEGNDRWQNVLELRTKLHDYDQLGGEAALDQFLEEAALVQDVDSLDAGESDALTLITLHAAKGLEFPYVFIVGLEEGICPHSRSVDSRDQLEEERRLLYVGVTRAMRGLFLVHCFRRTTFGGEQIQTASRFLADIPRELLDASFSRAAGGAARSANAASSPGWGRGAGGAGRFSGGSRQSRRPAAYQGSAMPGQAAGGWPRLPSRPDRYPEIDTGVVDGAERRGGPIPTSPGLWDDPAAGGDADLDLGVSPGDPGAAPRPHSAAPAGSRRDGSGGRTASREARFGRGVRVRHLDYGVGTVIASSVVGSEELVLVRFDSRPDKPKNLSLSVHRLEPA